jgi:hypothetical protein
VPIATPPFGAIRDFETAQAFGRKDRPIGDRADEARGLVAKQILANLRANAVRTDYDVDFCLPAICKKSRTAPLVSSSATKR